ncbi:hypothetical protein OG474_22735 [Kribbella sp. NBC_01505]|uniref:hypothetical protein n=1 Tax=Kribbella sp. NBC_01505 TaxID=2903580 RepID=UPI00386FBB8D
MTPSKPKPKPTVKPAPAKCVGTFTRDNINMSLIDGSSIVGGSFTCGADGQMFTPEQVKNGVRIYVGEAAATARLGGKAVAIGGYTVQVRSVKGNTTVFEVTPR